MMSAINRFSEDFMGSNRMAEEAPIVQVEQGSLQGRVNTGPNGKTYYSFQGIPYAKPPLGSLRFKAPQPAEPWEGIRDATSEGNVCAQINRMTDSTFDGDENCLFLNIYTPNLDGEFLPVMFWVHGGGFTIGSGNTSFYGPDYLVEKDAVVVTVNYRLGPLGFLALNTPEVPGNAGLKDIVQALRWVKENIHKFGGNTFNITVFGESAGGAISSLLTASPASKELFQKVIIQSGTALNSWAFQKNPVEQARNLAKHLGCESEDVDDILDFLTATPVKELVEASDKMSPYEEFFRTFSINFAPVVEKEFPEVEPILTEAFIDILTSGRVEQIPVMIGSTTLEFAKEPWTDDLQIFIPEELKIEVNSEESVKIADQIKRLYFKGAHIGVESFNEYFQLLSDRTINIDTHRYIQYLIQSATKPVYFYKFDYIGELNLTKKLLASLGLEHAGHLDDLGYLFKNDFQKDVEPTPQDIKMRERMVRLWTNFAKTGNPTPDECHILPLTWLPVTKETFYYMNLGAELSLGTDYDKERMEFWDSLYMKYFKIWEHPKQNTEEVPRKKQEIALETEQETEKTEVDGTATHESEPELSQPTSDAHTDVAPTNDATTDVAPTNDAPTDVAHTNDAPTDVAPANDVPTDVAHTNDASTDVAPTNNDTTDNAPTNGQPIVEVTSAVSEVKIASPEANGVESKPESNHVQAEEPKPQLNGVSKPAKTSNEIKMATSNGVARDVIRANDPPEDDRPKDFGVNKFVNFFESLGGKKN